MLTRRELLLGAPLPLFGFAKPAPVRPNIVLLMAQDVGAWTLGSYGNKEFRTPQLDRFARGGTRFIFSYAPAPVAAASQPTWNSLRDALSKSGYKTQDVEKSTIEEVTQAAEAYLRQTSITQPFMLRVNYPALLSLKNVQDASIHPFLTNRFEGFNYEPASAAAARDKDKLGDPLPHIRRYGGALAVLDAHIPLIQKALAEQKLADNTIVVFTSAAGVLLGQHGLWGQGDASQNPNFYEPVVAVPLLWTWPGRVPAEGVMPEIVDAGDTALALGEAAGAQPGAAGTARSLLPLVQNQKLPKKQPWKQLAFAGYDGVQMVRDSRYKLILRPSGKGTSELFDLRSDAAEKVNQYANPTYVAVRNELTNRLQSTPK